MIGLGQSLFGDFRGRGGPGGGVHQAAARGLLQILLNSAGERGTFLQKLASCRIVGRIKLVDGQAQPDRLREVLLLQLEPGAAG